MPADLSKPSNQQRLAVRQFGLRTTASMDAPAPPSAQTRRSSQRNEAATVDEEEMDQKGLLEFQSR
jgi:hypothetical protein